eukprot:gene1655-2474_t
MGAEAAPQEARPGQATSSPSGEDPAGAAPNPGPNDAGEPTNGSRQLEASAPEIGQLAAPPPCWPPPPPQGASNVPPPAYPPVRAAPYPPMPQQAGPLPVGTWPPPPGPGQHSGPDQVVQGIPVLAGGNQGPGGYVVMSRRVQAWDWGLCGCFSDCGLCVDTFFCSACLIGRTYSAVIERRPDSMNVSVCTGVVACRALLLLVAIHPSFLWLPWCSVAGFLFWMRTKLRGAHGLEGGPFYDFTAVLCCQPCTEAQEAHEMAVQGVDPGYVCCRRSQRVQPRVRAATVNVTPHSQRDAAQAQPGYYSSYPPVPPIHMFPPAPQQAFYPYPPQYPTNPQQQQ